FHHGPRGISRDHARRARPRSDGGADRHPHHRLRFVGGVEAFARSAALARRTLPRGSRGDWTASVTAPEIRVTRCEDCGSEIATGLLACPGCARLVHRDELTELAAVASSAEKAGDLTAALGAWRRTLELLPRASTQHATIHARMAELGAAIDGRGAA